MVYTFNKFWIPLTTFPKTIFLSSIVRSGRKVRLNLESNAFLSSLHVDKTPGQLCCRV